MAVPARIFVGITIFALACSLLVVPYTIAVYACQAAPDVDLPGIPCNAYSQGTRLFLALASVFTVAFTVLSWKALVAGARRDAARRRALARGEADPLAEAEGAGAVAAPAKPRR